MPASAPTPPVVLVTGATGALGRAAVAAFGAQGARLGLAGTDEARLAAVAADAGLADDAWVAAVGDLTSRDAARAAIDAVFQRFGRVDVLLHLVGGYAGGTPIAELDPADVAAMLDQHAWSTLHVVQALTPGMAERGWGRVIVVSAPVTQTFAAKQLPYAIGKGAEEAIVRTLARELAGSGVTANILVIKKLDAERERETAPSPKNAGWTTPEEVVAAMRYLCSDEAAAITGARIPLDGRG